MVTKQVPQRKVIHYKLETRSNLLTNITNMLLMRIGLKVCSGAHY
ncbi:hypothetical protein VIBNISFn27_480001 [Vibrio nigripulchritudo SFn27]|uniref:Uncharacterized protein n=1 Tax=Vibrio nigripulchritudo TaxID=28173 RepID=U4KFS2_9VIBR|nr:hypothetical protein VIBNIBLFn1_600001 [Vibrio nigripulchritudo BLFn1]CCN88727.1 hypothetical protein VIBNISFn27_480001 [Vibrio nigripulchritudo SFn27]CCN95044.1 hypothetical protein VIBNIENn2_470120 [Vibrio nigripulchritudo ENn2]CCO41072.1 hypothetical protein VIBNISFn135_410001 [Vibrio nigripulchritudo SFn135]CCO52389.1 hypothetical protein VIBNIWn13_330001 [Vibrio nigripulchritudo Wn13]CCO58088.1 hypothetical protein VIBNI_A1997 [Vibrio nigripulchritudo]